MKRNKNGYLFVSGHAGCLPETVYHFDTLKAAKEEARRWKDDMLEAGYRVSGNLDAHWRYQASELHSTYGCYIEEATPEAAREWRELE